jgi:hypothetical protein
MPVYVGGTEIPDGNLSIGGTSIAEVYIGANRIWPPVVSVTHYRLLEDGTDRRLLEDGTDLRLLESGSGVSPEAQAVLDRMTALDQTESDAIVTFVDGCVTDGNWTLLDEFYCFALNSTDWLTGFKQFSATLTGTITRTANGASLSGAAGEHIATGCVMNALAQYQTADALIGLYMHTVNDWGTQNYDFFGVENAATTRVRMRHRGSDTNDFRCSMNSSIAFDNDVLVADLPGKYFSLRATATLQEFLENATPGSVTAGAPAEVPALEMWIGGANGEGSQQQNSQASVVTSFYVGAGSINLSALQGRINTLQTAIGVT